MSSLTPREATIPELDVRIAALSVGIRKLRQQRLALIRKARKEERAKSDRIIAIKRAYLANKAPLREIGDAFNTSPGHISNLAREFGWPNRSIPKARGQEHRWRVA